MAIMISIQPQWVERVKKNDKVVEYAIGYFKERLINIYQNMQQRCNNPKSARYARYGGRGIEICQEWTGTEGKKNFIEWALDNNYEPDLSIERIDIDKGYSPENCKWIPLCEQSKNTRRTHIITHNGETKCLEDWCKQLNMPSTTIYYRAKNNGWDWETALFNYRPYHKNDKRFCPNGHEYTEENSGVDSKGYRFCKICMKNSRIKHKQKQRRIK